MRAVVNSAGVFIRSKVVTFIILYFPVNYRGSVGFGQSSLLSLPGNIGTQDVRDVQVTLIDVVDGLIVRYINKHVSQTAENSPYDKKIGMGQLHHFIL